MATTIAARQQASTTAVRRAGFGNTLASEWTKLFSVRSTYIMIALGVLLSFGLSALVGAAVGSTYDDWSEAEQADFEPIMFSMAGITLGGIVFGVFGVLAASGEYTSGMIRTTLAATPQRGRILAAKAVLVAGVLMVLSLISVTGMFLIGQAILGSYDMPTASLSDGDALRAVLALGVTGPFFPLIGLCLAFVLRSTAGAITATLGVLWLPDIFGSLLPNWWQENVISYLPGPSLDSATIGHIVDSAYYGDPVRGAFVAAGWLVAFFAAAYLSLTKRDA